MTLKYSPHFAIFLISQGGNFYTILGLPRLISNLKILRLTEGNQKMMGRMFSHPVNLTICSDVIGHCSSSRLYCRSQIGQNLLSLQTSTEAWPAPRFQCTLIIPFVSSSSKDPISKASAAFTSPLGGMSGGGYFCW